VKELLAARANVDQADEVSAPPCLLLRGLCAVSCGVHTWPCIEPCLPFFLCPLPSTHASCCLHLCFTELDERRQGDACWHGALLQCMPGHRKKPYVNVLRVQQNFVELLLVYLYSMLACFLSGCIWMTAPAVWTKFVEQAQRQ